MPSGICWREPDGTRTAGLNRTNNLDGPVTMERLHGTEHDGITVYAVGQMCGLLERELKSRAGIDVQWGSKVVSLKSGLGDSDDSAAVEVEQNDSTRTYTADYVFGTDGGNSTIRRLMFGRNFPGFSVSVTVFDEPGRNSTRNSR